MHNVKKSLIVAILVISVALLAGCKKTLPKTSSSESPPKTSSQDEAFKNALNLYAKKKQEGIDFTNGPCLGIIAPDWVLDIAHNPRQSVDDKPENQCADFREGRAHHFIELDPDGKLIQIY